MVESTSSRYDKCSLRPVFFTTSGRFRQANLNIKIATRLQVECGRSDKWSTGGLS